MCKIIFNKYFFVAEDEWMLVLLRGTGPQSNMLPMSISLSYERWNSDFLPKLILTRIMDVKLTEEHSL